jgi:DNA repair exonuclease SbcCD ATPase subunit
MVEGGDPGRSIPMNRRIPDACRFGRRAAVSLAALVLSLVVIAAPVSAQTEADRFTKPDAITPVEEFSKQLDAFKKSIPDLNKKIEDSVGSVDRWTNAEQARKEIEDLRAIVGAALGSVSDNGPVSQLGAKALAHAREKLRTIEQETRFKPEEKQFLLEQWRRLKEDTEKASDELGSARKEFTELLRVLQANEDFIDELVQIRQAQMAVDVIRRLTKDIRDASDQLKRLIGGIKTPGA